MTAFSGLNATANLSKSSAGTSTIVESEDRKLFLKLFQAIEPQRKHTVPKHFMRVLMKQAWLTEQGVWLRCSAFAIENSIEPPP